MFDGLFEFCQLSAGGSVGKLATHLFFSSPEQMYVILVGGGGEALGLFLSSLIIRPRFLVTLQFKPCTLADPFVFVVQSFTSRGYCSDWMKEPVSDRTTCDRKNPSCSRDLIKKKKKRKKEN